MSEGNSGESPEEWIIRRAIEQKKAQDTVQSLCKALAEEDVG